MSTGTTTTRQDAGLVLADGSGRAAVSESAGDEDHHDEAEPTRSRPKGTVSMAPGETDLGNAQRLVKRYGDDFHYCAPWHKFLVWDRRRWAIDLGVKISQLAVRTVQSIYKEAAVASDRGRREVLVKHAQQSENAARLRAMKEIAPALPGVAILPDELDTDPWLLNCENGTIDLRTGQSRPADRSDLITKVAPVAFDPNAVCPTWERFLDAIFAGRQSLIEFVWRYLGYCLTASVREQVLVILYGIGANGKSTLIETVLSMLGPDYAMKAAPDLLMVKGKGDAHPTERADLFGKRFVACVETEDGRRLAEGLVKELTGGDRIRARRMREDFWEFAPTHKVPLATNHRPIIQGTDHAIWRRIRLLPFDVVIADADQDKDLPQKLRAELPGILAWCVRGCLAWQRDGLGIPDEVQLATQEYRAAEDVLGQFLVECCIVQQGVRAKSKSLFAAYQKHCEDTGEQPLNHRRFGLTLGERGFEKYTNNGTWYEGIGLNSDGWDTEGTEPTEPIFGINDITRV